MNDKIRKLAEEHGFIHEHMTIGEQNDALNKYRDFAELIIRECSSMIESQDVDPAFKFRMSRAFKKSFGITE